MVKIPVFPIPNCVTFPGTTFPLHVFEPRYRSMIDYCLENDTLLGIAHTQKVVRDAKPGQVLEEALQSNQATYKPFPVFSAGRCELLKVLDDGRLYLHVHMESRFLAVAEEQTLPFTICRCDSFIDRPVEANQVEEIDQLKEKVVTRLLAMTSNVPDIHNLLQSEKWTSKRASDFSFAIFGLLQFEPGLQQDILEMSSAKERLNCLLGILNKQSSPLI
ncbi:MAG: Lon protease-like protein [Cellvibrionaceae bacterium]|jgi:Lon protease-like protein